MVVPPPHHFDQLTPGVRSVLNHATLQRSLVAVVQVLALAVWFSASAVVPVLSRDWSITATEAVWLTASVQIGFVAGALSSALTNLADRVRPHLLLAFSATGAAVCTAVCALTADSLAVAVPLRLATGVFLAGVYPVGMKLMASWSAAASRASSFGVLLGALTVGSALPHLIGTLELPWRELMLAAAAIAFTGAVLSLIGIRPGPHVNTRASRANHKYVLQAFRNRRLLLANLGYFGHMWELYALWTWLPSFALASTAGGGVASTSVSVAMFCAVGLAGLAGCLAGGWTADRFGRRRTAIVALVVSGCCCLLSPFTFAWSWPAMVAFFMVWGAAVIADSGVFSVLVSETAESECVGTALTMQTAIGFLLTVVTIQFVPVLADLASWQYAFLVLAAGPVVGVIAMSRLSPSTRPPAR